MIGSMYGDKAVRSDFSNILAVTLSRCMGLYEDTWLGGLPFFSNGQMIDLRNSLGICSCLMVLLKILHR